MKIMINKMDKIIVAIILDNNNYKYWKDNSNNFYYFPNLFDFIKIF